MSGLQVGSFDLPVNTVYKSAKTVKTMLGQAIIEVARDCSAKVHVNKGSIFIRDRIRDKNRGNEVGFILDKDHGLIGTPSPIITSYDVGIDENRRTINRAGFKVLSLLHHRVTTDSVIQIKSKTANGLFRVEKGKHKANGNTYYTEMEVYSAMRDANDFFHKFKSKTIGSLNTCAIGQIENYDPVKLKADVRILPGETLIKSVPVGIQQTAEFL